MALVYFVVFAIVWIIFAIVSLFIQMEPEQMGPGVDRPMMMLGSLFAVVIYPIIIFAFTVVAAWIYNLVAKLTGGIEFTLKDPKERG